MPPPAHEPRLARIAALVADATRARMLGYLLGGVIVAEVVFAYPGIGELALSVLPPQLKEVTAKQLQAKLKKLAKLPPLAAPEAPRDLVKTGGDDRPLGAEGPAGAVTEPPRRHALRRGLRPFVGEYVALGAEIEGYLRARIGVPAGRIAWGARTRQGDDRLASEWKYLPVRRLALYIEESLYRGTQWVVFEPNDEPLWAQIRLNVGAFMNGLFRQGAFQGTSPRDAYFVKCDRETTTQNDIDAGIVNIHVGFAPLKPAEFVVIRIQQIAGDL